MIENRLFFLCEPCSDAVCVAVRAKGPYAISRNDVTVNEWFKRHAKCGNTEDHFSLVYEQEPDGNAVIATPEDQGKLLTEHASDTSPDEPRH